jgi:general secretion pathway protein K
MNQVRAGRRRKDRGIALVMTLWVLILLGLIAASFLRDSRLGTNLARNITENAKAEALADAGVNRAMLGLLDNDMKTAWRANGIPHQFAFGDGVVEIRIFDETGKIDLNRAPAPILLGLLKTAGLDDNRAGSLADAINDFRDPDHDRRPSGAEDPDYLAAGVEAGAKDAPFEDPEELMQVLGITRELYNRISPYITVYSNRSRVNLLTASDFVLSAIPNLTPEQIKKIQADRLQATQLQRTQSEVVTVRAEAKTSTGGVFVREAVLKRGGEAATPFQILSWRQGRGLAPEQEQPAHAQR